MALWNPFGKKKRSEESAEQAPSTPPESAPPESENVTPPPAPPTDAQPPSEPEPEPEKKPKKSKLSWLKSAMQKTSELLKTDIRDLVKEGRVVDDEFLDELYADFIKTDMGVGPASKIRDDIHSRFRARKLFMKDLVATSKETITEIMAQDDAGIQFAESGPTIIMVVGVNGAGKTTSIAKLAHRFTTVSYTHLTLPTIYSV